MKHRATHRFWQHYERLPREIQQFADRYYNLLKRDPRHPSLRFKKVGRFHSIRIGLHYRALAVDHEDGPAWFWIGTHAEYDHLVGR